MMTSDKELDDKIAEFMTDIFSDAERNVEGDVTQCWALMEKAGQLRFGESWSDIRYNMKATFFLGVAAALRFNTDPAVMLDQCREAIEDCFENVGSIGETVPGCH